MFGELLMSSLDVILDIIIPVYNEAENISAILEQFKLHIKTNYRILICYDFDEDNTLPVIKKYQDQFNIKLIKNASIGSLAAIVTGFKQSVAPYILVYPADDFINTKIIDHMVMLAQNGADIVCPSRFMPNGKMENAPFVKALLLRCGNFFLHYFIKIGTHDASNGFRLFSRKVLEHFTIESKKGFTYSIELLVKAHRSNFSIQEIPSIWIERTKGNSRFKVFSWLPTYIRWVLYAVNTRLFYA